MKDQEKLFPGMKNAFAQYGFILAPDMCLRNEKGAFVLQIRSKGSRYRFERADGYLITSGPMSGILFGITRLCENYFYRKPR